MRMSTSVPVLTSAPGSVILWDIADEYIADEYIADEYIADEYIRI